MNIQMEICMSKIASHKPVCKMPFRLKGRNLNKVLAGMDEGAVLTKVEGNSSMPERTGSIDSRGLPNKLFEFFGIRR